MKVNNLKEIFEKNTEKNNLSKLIFINNETIELSYAQLYNKVTEKVDILKKTISAGQLIILQLENKLEFIVNFWALVMLNAIPVLYPITNEIENTEICKKCKINKIIYDGKIININADVCVNNMKEGKLEDNIALIQFSSGSTSMPKGVVLTEKNILSNVYSIIDASKTTNKDIFFNWLPLYHNFGIIASHILSIISNCSQVIMPTKLFFTNIIETFKEIDNTKATILPLPNFALRFINSKIDLFAKHNIDLSRIRIIPTAGEVISYEECEKFINYFIVFGLNPNSIFTSYGLAEVTSAATCSIPQEKVKYHILDRNIKNINKYNFDLSNNKIVSCGYPLGCNKIWIEDQNNQVLPEDNIGTIIIKGDNVLNNYYTDNKLYNLKIEKIDTGDIGFFHSSELYVIGRKKDIVILNGKNYWINDIKKLINDNLKNIKCVYEIVVFAFTNSKNINESLGIAISSSKNDFDNLRKMIYEIIMNNIGFVDIRIKLINKIPKTISGKVRYHELKQEFCNIETEKSKIIFEKNPYILKIRNIIEKQLNKKLRDEDCNDFFTNIGIDSLSIESIRLELEGLFFVPISIETLKTNPTICQLAKYIQNKTFVNF